MSFQGLYNNRTGYQGSATGVSASVGTSIDSSIDSAGGIEVSVGCGGGTGVFAGTNTAVSIGAGVSEGTGTAVSMGTGVLEGTGTAVSVGRDVFVGMDVAVLVGADVLVGIGSAVFVGCSVLVAREVLGDPGKSSLGSLVGSSATLGDWTISTSTSSTTVPAFAKTILTNLAMTGPNCALIVSDPEIIPSKPICSELKTSVYSM
jgi:hypothetical protein